MGRTARRRAKQYPTFAGPQGKALPAHEDNDKKPIGQAMSTKPPAVSDDEVEEFKKKNPDKFTVLKPSKKGMPKKNKEYWELRGATDASP